MKKLTKLTIRNIGLIEESIIELNKPMLLFYGDIRQGKSTILNAVRWCFGGAFPEDVIRHGAAEAVVRLDFEGGWISREWYRGKDGETKARSVEYVDGGKVVANPVSELKRFLNPFLLNQEHLRDMTELERRRYFVEVFGINTAEFDEPLRKLEHDASELRIVIKSYGEPDVTPVELQDELGLKAQLDAARQLHATEQGKRQQELAAIRETHEAARRQYVALGSDYATSVAKRAEISARLQGRRARIEELKVEIAEIETRCVAIEAELQAVPVPMAPVEPPAPDTSAIEAALRTPLDTAALEAKIVEAARTNVRHGQYLSNLKKIEQKKADKELLLGMERQEREFRQSKIDKLKKLAEDTGIPGLEFNEDLSFSFQGTSSGMLSTSQLMTLSSAIAAKYPEGFGLELIDRAESLGTSIFSFVEKAKQQEKTILATIVGERPAKAPEEVGVFVVNGGKVA